MRERVCDECACVRMFARIHVVSRVRVAYDVYVRALTAHVGPGFGKQQTTRIATQARAVEAFRHVDRAGNYIIVCVQALAGVHVRNVCVYVHILVCPSDWSLVSASCRHSSPRDYSG